MIDKKIQQHIVKHLVKLHDKSITEAEREELLKWGEEHSYYKTLIEKMQKQDSYQNWRQERDAVETDKAWLYVNSYIRKNKVKKITLTSMRFAAVATISLFIGIAVYFIYKSNESINKQVAHVEIEPGSRCAELVMSNGQVVILGQTQNTLQEHDGTFITTDTALVSYSSKKNLESKTNLINEVRVKRGQEYQLILADGTKVWINSMSSIKFPVQFTSRSREVTITGEVYFEVEPDAKRPFIVHTPVHDVQVLGTTFNISCYQDDVTAQTTLVEGSVKVSKTIGSLEELKMKPNQQYIFDKTALKSELRNVDASIYTAWTSGYFQFEEETLEEVFKKLTRWYNIDVFFVDNQQRFEYFTGRLPRFEKVDVILKMIEKVSNVKFEVDEHSIIIK